MKLKMMMKTKWSEEIQSREKCSQPFLRWTKKRQQRKILSFYLHTTTKFSSYLVYIRVCVCISFVFLLHLFRFFIFYSLMLLFFCGFLNCWFQCFQAIEYAMLIFFFFVSFCSREVCFFFVIFLFFFSLSLLSVRTKFVQICFVDFFSLDLHFHFVLNVFVYALNSELKADR